jgi:hypothetical protein
LLELKEAVFRATNNKYSALYNPIDTYSSGYILIHISLLLDTQKRITMLDTKTGPIGPVLWSF